MENIIIASLTLLLTLTSATEVPSYIHVCGRRNPNLDECVRESVGSLTEKLRLGMPELGVPSIEPMLVDKVSLADLPNFKAFARDVKLYGLANYIAKNIHVDAEKKTIDIDVLFKTVRLVADYYVNAKILVPIAGQGPIDIHAEDVQATVTMQFTVIHKNGNPHAFFPSMTTKLRIKDFTANFKPSDGPESPLAVGINSALQNSRQEILEGTIPNLERTISEKVLQMTNEICKRFTYDQLFPDRA